MPYHLLTGATGLLGRYLLRDSLLAGLEVAVIVRPDRRVGPRERVDQVLRHWEQQLGRFLPRPVILSGELNSPDLGLDANARRWVADHCHAIVHSAASLSFEPSEDGEPWRSNVAGTANVLHLAQSCRIRTFHHVSTAYVCGQRTGRVLESELDVGQELGNDYERSKVQAEKMVRNADFLETATFHRPSIIVGDSQTGYSSTFHGFYTPLRLGWAWVKMLPPEVFRDADFLAELQMSSQDRKNFVPVDWVSAAMTQIIARPELHGRTYHLTHPQPTPVALMHDVILAVLVEHTSALQQPGLNREPPAQDQSFRQNMEVYQAYWRDDPEFDATNTQTALPELSCPPIDAARIRRLVDYAIDTNFGWPAPPYLPVDFDLEAHLRPWRDGASDRAGASWVALDVTGSCGGQWNLLVDDGVPVAVLPGLTPDCTAIIHLSATTFAALADRRCSVEQALDRGRVVLEGARSQPDLVELLRVLAVRPANVSNHKCHELSAVSSQQSAQRP